MDLLATSPPRSVVFDLVLLLHVGVVLVAVVTLVSSYGAARALGAAPRGAVWPESAIRYFRPGPEIAGRSLYLIPISGVALVGLSQGAYEVSDAFIWLGAVLWVLSAGAAEHLVFSSGARLRRHLASAPSVEEGSWRTDATRVRWGVEVALALLVAAAVLMVAQP